MAGTALGLAGVPGTVLRPLALLVVQPLWFSASTSWWWPCSGGSKLLGRGRLAN